MRSRSKRHEAYEDEDEDEVEEEVEEEDDDNDAEERGGGGGGQRGDGARGRRSAALHAGDGGDSLIGRRGGDVAICAE